MNKEVWKDIIGYEGLYQVSNTGLIKSYEKSRGLNNGGYQVYPSRILKPEVMKLGYHRIMLSKEGISRKVLVHVLVAKHFLPFAGLDKEVNHKDGNKSNNDVSNLEYMTKSENVLHSYRVLGRVPANLK